RVLVFARICRTWRISCPAERDLFYPPEVLRRERPWLRNTATETGRSGRQSQCRSRTSIRLPWHREPELPQLLCLPVGLFGNVHPGRQLGSKVCGFCLKVLQRLLLQLNGIPLSELSEH